MPKQQYEMINADSYLVKLDTHLAIAQPKKEKVNTSIEYLKGKMWSLFQEKLSTISVFGSYARNTFVDGDEKSDVDILIVFKKNEFQPQTYLNQIETFCKNHYPRSVIYPDHPTVVIEMDHIKFELVPAHYYSPDAVKIPAPRNKELKWITTEPLNFKKKLAEKDKNNKALIVPLIRILKHWNYLNDKPFSSYELERSIVNQLYNCTTLRDYYFSAVSGLEENIKTEAQKKAYIQLKEKNRRIRVLEREKIVEYIEAEFSSFLPFPR